MYECFKDPDLGWVLIADAGVSCEASSSRTVVNAHIISICTVVGVGFPLYVFYKTRQLRANGNLVAGLPLTSLFEWYRPEVPYFEAIHMVRKLLLILMTTVFSTSLVQSIMSFVINAVFLAVLKFKDPMVYYPSSFFKGKNLFILVEMLSTTTSLVGNLLAILGAMTSSNDTVTAIGTVFAIMNISFGFLLFFGYAMDTKKIKSTVAPEIAASEGSRSQSMIKAVSNDVQSIEKEWNTHIAFIKASDGGSKGKDQMVRETKFLRTKLENEVRMVLMKDEEEMAKLQTEICENIEWAADGIDVELLQQRQKSLAELMRTFDRVSVEYNQLLIKLEQDVRRICGAESEISHAPASSVAAIASRENLRIISSLSARCKKCYRCFATSKEAHSHEIQCDDDFPVVDSRVVVIGLTEESLNPPEFNGLQGKVIKVLKNGVFRVSLDSRKKAIFLKAHYLLPSVEEAEAGSQSER